MFIVLTKRNLFDILVSVTILKKGEQNEQEAKDQSHIINIYRVGDPYRWCSSHSKVW